MDRVIRTDVRDRTGNTIAFLLDSPTDQRLYTLHGAFLGLYNKNADRTIDKNNHIVSMGNTVIMLLDRDKLRR